MMRSMKDESLELTTTCSCSDPIACLRHMFVDMTQKRRVEVGGQCPARRPVFLRTHGIIEGTITFTDSIPAAYRQGMFDNAGKTLPVYVRYSSDLSDGRPDWLSTIGIGIKIFGISGAKVVSDDGAGTADLLLQNVPFFFVDDAKAMSGFTKASFEGWGDEWVQRYSPVTSSLLDEMAKPIRSVFDTQLWSVVPFQLGASYCKYVLRPGTSTFATEPNINDPNFLAADLQGRLKAGPATLHIYVQKRPSLEEYSEAYLEQHFPLDRATVVWDEQAGRHGHPRHQEHLGAAPQSGRHGRRTSGAVHRPRSKEDQRPRHERRQLRADGPVPGHLRHAGGAANRPRGTLAVPARFRRIGQPLPAAGV
jgi:hypothetical protein